MTSCHTRTWRPEEGKASPDLRCAERLDVRLRWAGREKRDHMTCSRVSRWAEQSCDREIREASSCGCLVFWDADTRRALCPYLPPPLHASAQRNSTKQSHSASVTRRLFYILTPWYTLPIWLDWLSKTPGIWLPITSQSMKWSVKWTDAITCQDGCVYRTAYGSCAFQAKGICGGKPRRRRWSPAWSSASALSLLQWMKNSSWNSRPFSPAVQGLGACLFVHRFHCLLRCGCLLAPQFGVVWLTLSKTKTAWTALRSANLCPSGIAPESCIKNNNT